MKKYIVLISLLALILSLAGCKDKNLYTYSNKDDIQVETYSVDTLARITIVDTYKKNDVTYYILQTNVSDDREWTLSEAEYDEIIGLGNDAIDCTVHYLKCNTKIISQSYSPFFGSFLENALSEALRKLGAKYHNLPSTSIKSIYDMKFNSGEYYFCTVNSNGAEWIENKLTLKRYSFMGESSFTEEEINMYVLFMHKVASEMIKHILEEK